MRSKEMTGAKTFNGNPKKIMRNDHGSYDIQKKSEEMITGAKKFKRKSKEMILGAETYKGNSKQIQRNDHGS